MEIIFVPLVHLVWPEVSLVGFLSWFFLLLLLVLLLVFLLLYCLLEEELAQGEPREI